MACSLSTSTSYRKADAHARRHGRVAAADQARVSAQHHGSESRLTSFELEDFEQEVWAPAGALSAGFDASLGFIGGTRPRAKRRTTAMFLAPCPVR